MKKYKLESELTEEEKSWPTEEKLICEFEAFLIFLKFKFNQWFNI